MGRPDPVRDKNQVMYKGGERKRSVTMACSDTRAELSDELL